ncbi:methylaspartate mutase subunit S [Natronobacterium gregoryi]|uniref:Glutamate mutase sigma subunit n=2 Tax=Natronobacterium gregoryi TaxID=44930 RepID=L0AJK3_NATGS|nr:methylaspartate mutase subunit S [Natronobacterium gregoryi]AFZ73362.1 methylaspartate mutase, S subunit [Natronobacterium gregoryi SP2]ELY68559.1 methylaspartate mutase subunit S [Natronobacterium gregoryi SP2]PLK19644.1 methylaspartate mutase subunit S [Natronobacterium gregoryi SP2]SFI74021.1 glutamate mutase subunit S [Natronobacterium gregoryi]
MSQQSVVVGTIGSDAHVVGVTLLEHALEEAGFDVRNLGAQTPKETFVDVAAETDADALLVSSLYGHAEQDCEGLHEALAARDADPVTLIGGNLSVGQSDTAAVERRFEQLGFDHVFDTETELETVVDTLRADLGIDEAAKEPARIRS